MPMLPTIAGNRAPLTRSVWEESRRPEILSLFETHVYGVTPRESLHSCRYVLSEAVLSKDGETRTYSLDTIIEKDGFSCAFRTELFVPVNAEGPLPAVIMIDPFSNNSLFARTEAWLHGQMPYDMLNRAGIIGVYAHVDEICLDDPAAYQEGLLRVYPRRGESGWGAIGAWAWATSRVVDFLAGWPQANPAQIGVCGWSRAGKTALWCAAQDQRIALTISSVSGFAGAAITRGKTGEHIRDSIDKFPYWTCARFAGYAEDEESLPVDQHMLLALCAPRPLYVSSASEDDWADPKKEFESAALAGEIHRLYGKKGLVADAFPQINAPALEGDIGYHNREGEHGCFEYDWEQFIRFMRKYLA